MSIKYYHSAFDSDIFYLKDQWKDKDKEVPKQKYIFDYSKRPKDTVVSLADYMEKEDAPKEVYHIKVFTAKLKETDVLNAFNPNVNGNRRMNGIKRYATKSQISFGDDDMTSFIVKKPNAKSKSVEKDYSQCYKEDSAFQRKMSEFYGKEYSKQFDAISKGGQGGQKQCDNQPSTNDDAHNDLNMSEAMTRSYSTIGFGSGLGLGLNHTNRSKLKHKAIRVTKTDKTSYDNRVDFLKSNIFDDPNRERLNAYHTISPKERDIDVNPYISCKRIYNKPMSINRSFEISNRELNGKHISAKERKATEQCSSYDTIPMQQLIRKPNANESIDVNESIGSIEAKRPLKPRPSMQREEERIHQYEIDNIKDQDLKQIRQCFTNNGIHLYDASFKHNGINGTNAPQKISVKIRENVNDENFHSNLIKAKDKLMNDKGLMITQKSQLSIRSEANRTMTMTKPNGRMITSRKTKLVIRKPEPVTAIPFNVKYKNEFLNKK